MADGETTLSVRDAAPDDMAAAAALYARHVLHGVATFEEVPPDTAEMQRRLAAVRSVGLPWLVAEAQGSVLGYAYATPFRHRSAYRFVAEDAIYIADEARGRGVGKALLSALVGRCEALGLRQLMAVIGDSGNAGSIGLHAALGFQPCGRFAEVGYKHGRWLDIVLMQKVLNGGGAAPPEGPGLPLGL